MAACEKITSCQPEVPLEACLQDCAPEPDASIECLCTEESIAVPERIRSGKADGERVFKKDTSLIFKSMQVVRFYDKKRNVLVYMVYSDKLVDGSPKNSITVVKVE